MAWLILIVAGLIEAAWAVGLKYTEGFKKPLPSVLVILGIAGSLYMLAWSARTLPIGTAYAVWVGIGAAGAAILGMTLLGEPTNPARIFFITLLLIAVAGLKFTSH